MKLKYQKLTVPVSENSQTETVNAHVLNTLFFMNNRIPSFFLYNNNFNTDDNWSPCINIIYNINHIVQVFKLKLNRNTRTLCLFSGFDGFLSNKHFLVVFLQGLDIKLDPNTLNSLIYLDQVCTHNLQIVGYHRH